jgi:RNA polymerase sigma factor (sigma-70 family)
VSLDEQEEFESIVRLRLIEDDYRRLREFKGRSRISTFLHTVVLNLFRDYRVQLWGRWSHSEPAKRLGVVGMRLEELVFRDGYSHLEAEEIVRREHPAARASTIEVALEEVMKRRRLSHWSERAGLETESDDRAEDSVELRETLAVARRMSEALSSALAALTVEERTILRLIFSEGLRISQVASVLAMDQRPLYRRVPGLLAQLRERLEQAGLSGKEITEILNEDRLDVILTWQDETPPLEKPDDGSVKEYE